jgi:hypothetical protein
MVPLTSGVMEDEKPNVGRRNSGSEKSDILGDGVILTIAAPGF